MIDRISGTTVLGDSVRGVHRHRRVLAEQGVRMGTLCRRYVCGECGEDLGWE